MQPARGDVAAGEPAGVVYTADLVTDDAQRSNGHGARLLQWLRVAAAEAGCDELHLDSGVQRFDAHRFYLRLGMKIASHHFSEELQRRKCDAK